MNSTETKLEKLQNVLGEKKLKQLGLLVCPTCNKIMAQSLKLTIPPDLASKGYLTPEEMSTITQTFSKSATTLLNISGNDTATTSDEQTPLTSSDSENGDTSLISSNSENGDTSLTSSNNENGDTSAGNDGAVALSHSIDNDTTTMEAANSTADVSSNTASSDDDHSANLETTITSDKDLLDKLFSIIKQSQEPIASELDMGYIYSCPSYLPHSLICPECGKYYAIAHPTYELLPLPVYLTDAEYEMIKGVYVDILL